MPVEGLPRGQGRGSASGGKASDSCLLAPEPSGSSQAWVSATGDYQLDHIPAEGLVYAGPQDHNHHADTGSWAAESPYTGFKSRGGVPLPYCLAEGP